MRKLLFMILILFLCGPASAATVMVKTSQMIYNNSQLKPGQALELRLGYDNYFIYGSNSPLEMWGQWIDMRSFGAGAVIDLWQGFSGFLKVGYDMPDYSKDNFGWEGVYFYQCQSLAPTYFPQRFQHYTAEIKDAFTGEVGLSYDYLLTKHIAAGLSASYKYAKHTLNTYGLNKDGVPGQTGWQTNDQFDFGGYNVGFQVRYVF